MVFVLLNHTACVFMVKIKVILLSYSYKRRYRERAACSLFAAILHRRISIAQPGVDNPAHLRTQVLFFGPRPQINPQRGYVCVRDRRSTLARLGEEESEDEIENATSWCRRFLSLA